MTYNFDPEQWYEREHRILDLQHQAGKLDDEQFEAALADLEDRYEKMLDRLDGTFNLP